MLNLKPAVSDALSETSVEKVKIYSNSPEVISDAEKLVFYNSAIAVGSITCDSDILSLSFTKRYYTVDLFLFTKSSSAKESLSSTAAEISRTLRLKDFGFDEVLVSEITYISEPEELTDRISYVTLKLEISTIEQG